MKRFGRPAKVKEASPEQSRDPDTDGIQYNESPHIIALFSDNSCNIKTDDRRKEQIKSINQTYLC